MSRYPKVRIAGLDVEVVPEHIAETVAFTVCANWDGPVYFTDESEPFASRAAWRSATGLMRRNDRRRSA
jgi:hypothetical protein